MIPTPYDGSHKPFTIGLSQLDPDEWIEVDDKLISYLTEKRRLYDSERRNVLVEEADTREAQQEVLDLLSDYLPKRYPQNYMLAENKIVIGGQKSLDLSDPGLNPLAKSALLIQDDLVLMRKSPEGWRLVAASLCFPSAWNLLEKFGKPLHEVHSPVPGFGAGTRNAGLIERMFDNLHPERFLIRWNWSLYGDQRLYHPVSDHGVARRFGTGKMDGKVFIRMERQTLRKLPKSGDILFTIGIHLDPLEVMRRLPDGAKLAQAMAEQIGGLSEEEIHYKGLVGERERLLARLSELARR